MNSMKAILNLFFLFLICNHSFAQQVSFEKWFDYGFAEEGRCVQQTKDGGYIIAGRQGIGTGSSKHLLIKTDSLGNEQWHKAFGANHNELNSIKQTFDGGYVITGQSSTQTFGYNIFWAKTDNNGDTVWTRESTTMAPDYYGSGADIIQTKDTGYLILAEMADTNHSFICVLIKTNEFGDTLWTKKYGSAFPGIVAYQCKETYDSAYIIVGQMCYEDSIHGIISCDVYLMKINFDGDTLWTKAINHGQPNIEKGYNIEITSDSGYFVRGYVGYLSTGKQDIHILKTDKNGDTLWARNIGGTDNRSGSGADKKRNGGYILSGAADNNSGSIYLFLASVDDNGDTLWTKTFDDAPSIDAYGEFIRCTSDGGYIITGYRSSDAFLIKTDTSGSVTIGINEVLYKANPIIVYPNPFHVFTTLALPEEITYKHDMAIKISDIAGRVLYNEKVKSGAGSIIIQRNNMSPGAYLLQLFSGSQLFGVTKLIIE